MSEQPHGFLRGPDPNAAPAPSGGRRTSLEPLLSIRETAAFLNVSEHTVRRLVARRSLPCVRLNRQLRFAPDALLKWLSARKEG